MALIDKFFQNLPLPLYVIAVALHSIGIYLLNLSKQKGRIQDYIMMNLAVAEIGMCCADFTQNILSREQGTVHQSLAIEYLTIWQCSIFVLPSFFIMITLTLDRLFEIYYSIQYQIHVTLIKAKWVLFFCWSVGIVTGAITFSLRHLLNIDVKKIIFMYIFPITEGIFMIIAIITYSYIYRKLKQSQSHPATRKNKDPKSNYQQKKAKKVENAAAKSGTTGEDTSDLSWNFLRRVAAADIKWKRNWRRGFRRNFFAPSLIILTFVLFVILPDIVNLLLFYVYGIGTVLHSNILLTMYVCGFIADAIIYIFLQRKLRRLLIRKICRLDILSHWIDTSSNPESTDNHRSWDDNLSIHYVNRWADNGGKVESQKEKQTHTGLQEETNASVHKYVDNML